MITTRDFQRLAVLDIETVPMVAHYEALDADFQRLWDRKADTLRKRDPARYADENAPLFAQCAGIFPEFGRIVAISVGCLREKGGNTELHIKNLFDHDETALLKAFVKLLDRIQARLNDQENRQKICLCGHNAKEFDFPFLARRMLICGLPLPEPLRLHGKKPWEVPHLDTCELWKFGDYKSYTSLDLLSKLFGVPTSKDDIDGSQVGTVYYGDAPDRLARIAHYCGQDVRNTAQVLLRLSGLPLVDDAHIHYRDT